MTLGLVLENLKHALPRRDIIWSRPAKSVQEHINLGHVLVHCTDRDPTGNSLPPLNFEKDVAYMKDWECRKGHMTQREPLQGTWLHACTPAHADGKGRHPHAENEPRFDRALYAWASTSALEALQHKWAKWAKLQQPPATIWFLFFGKGHQHRQQWTASTGQYARSYHHQQLKDAQDEWLHGLAVAEVKMHRGEVHIVCNNLE